MQSADVRLLLGVLFALFLLMVALSHFVRRRSRARKRSRGFRNMRRPSRATPHNSWKGH